MRRKKFVSIVLAVPILTVFCVFLFFKLGSPENAHRVGKKVEAVTVSFVEPVTVQLPAGELIQVVPAESAHALFAEARFRTLYVIRDRKTSRVTFFQAGDSPGSWEEILYLQER